MGSEFKAQVDLSNENTLKILKDNNIGLEEKAQILECSTDELFQNVYDLEGKVIQETPFRSNYTLTEALDNGSLGGKTVLDLGCNCGRYLIEAITLGAEYVIGVDHKEYFPKFIEYLNIGDRAEFVKDNIITYKPEKEVDVVLLFDLMCYFSEEDVDKILDNMISYAKEKILIIDVFSGDYSHFVYKVMKIVRSKGKKIKIRDINDEGKNYIVKLISIEI